jgi:hypothetical protein
MFERALSKDVNKLKQFVVSALREETLCTIIHDGGAINGLQGSRLRTLNK